MSSSADRKPPAFGQVVGTAELNEALYNPDDVETGFLLQQTGLEDPEEVKKHILQVQRELYAIYPYACIRFFHFAQLKIVRFPIYKELLALGKERPGALFLDMGCCVGNDTRKPIADGFPANQVIAVDLKPEFWEIGHKIFNSTLETLPVKFIAGDILDKSFLEPGLISMETPPTTVDLSSLTSLTPLHGKISAIHASSFFHLFGEEQQSEIAYLLGSLLSPAPGSIIFGTHAGSAEKSLQEHKLSSDQRVKIFSHSPESWNALWDEVFVHGKVETRAYLRERTDLALGGCEISNFLVWSVKRL